MEIYSLKSGDGSIIIDNANIYIPKISINLQSVAGGGGLLLSIVTRDNIIVDNTDPQNHGINATDHLDSLWEPDPDLFDGYIIHGEDKKIRRVQFKQLEPKVVQDSLI
jgi:hypothetical protein